MSRFEYFYGKSSVFKYWQQRRNIIGLILFLLFVVLEIIFRRT